MLDLGSGLWNGTRVESTSRSVGGTARSVAVFAFHRYFRFRKLKASRNVWTFDRRISDSLLTMLGKQVRILTRFGWIALAELSLPTPSSGGAKLAHPIVRSSFSART